MGTKLSILILLGRVCQFVICNILQTISAKELNPFCQFCWPRYDNCALNLTYSFSFWVQKQVQPFSFVLAGIGGAVPANKELLAGIVPA
jgi:hypothetical protein